MMFARRLQYTDDLGDLVEDFVAVDVHRSDPRPVDRLPTTRRHDLMIRYRAIKALEAAKFTKPEIVVALNLSERQVRRYFGVLREMAKEGGRV